MSVADTEPVASSRSRLLTLVAVFALALLLRAGWATHRSGGQPGAEAQLQFPDEREYWSLAVSLRETGELALPNGDRAKRMGLYPALLSPFVHLTHPVLTARLAQSILGALAAVGVAALAMRLAGVGAGLLAGALVAVDPFAVFFSSLLLTETPFAAALVGFILCSWPLIEEPRSLSPPRLVIAAALAIACVYLRPEAVGFVALWTVVALARRRSPTRARVQIALIPIFVIALLVPWALRNRVVLAEWVWLTTNGGASLFDGQGPQADGSSNLDDVFASPAVSQMSELQRDAFLHSQALQTMRSDPARVLRLAAIKFVRTWNIWPNFSDYRSAKLRAISAAYMVPVLLLAAVGLWALRDRLRIALVLLLPAMYWTAVHCVFVGSLRYRQPAMPFVEILAALGLALLVSSAKRPRSRPMSPASEDGS
jgi:hypothetical protein